MSDLWFKKKVLNALRLHVGIERLAGAACHSSHDVCGAATAICAACVHHIHSASISGKLEHLQEGATSC